MNIFFEVKNTLINISKIKDISLAEKHSVRITFDDDSEGVYETREEAFYTLELLGKTAVQLIPCAAPMFNVFKNEDGSYFHERVSCLALCADGAVRSLTGADYIAFAEEEKNFVGFYDEGGLTHFPTISKQG